MKVKGLGVAEYLAELRAKQESSKSESAGGAQVERRSRLLEESRVDVSLGRLLQSDETQGERRSRVERLKALIDSGSYNPPLKDVAQATGLGLLQGVSDLQRLVVDRTEEGV